MTAESREQALSVATQTGKAFGTSTYRGFFLGTLTLVYTLSAVDRLLIGVVAQPIIDEFQIKDWEFGLLSGFGFMITYTLAGIPIARAAEKHNRVSIIAVCLFIWSLMTILCGFAWGFVSLLIFRIGLSIGEAGCVPPANSLISDYYPARSRAKAIAIFGLGVPLGGIAANLIGGPVTDAFGWRHTFIFFGIPGIAVAIVLWIAGREPPRGYADEPGTEAPEGVGLLDTAKALFQKTTFWWITGASLLASMTGGALANFQAPLFQRLHEITVGEVAVYFVFPMAAGAAVGAFVAGWLTEKLSPRYPNSVAWIPGAAVLASLPFFLVSLTSETKWIGVGAHALAATLMYTYLGNQYAIVQGISAPTSRATAVAIFLLMNNLLGSGLGPLVAGALSDSFAALALAASEIKGALAVADCKGTTEELIRSIGEAALGVCRAATRDGLQQSLLVMVSLAAPTGLGFLLACKKLQRDLVAKFSG